MVRHIAASNYGPPRLEEALALSDDLGLARYVALQPHYSLVERYHYEGELPTCACARPRLRPLLGPCPRLSDR